MFHTVRKVRYPHPSKYQHVNRCKTMGFLLLAKDGSLLSIWDHLWSPLVVYYTFIICMIVYSDLFRRWRTREQLPSNTSKFTYPLISQQLTALWWWFLVCWDADSLLYPYMVVLASNIEPWNESCSTQARGTKWRTAPIWLPISVIESWD